MRPSRPRASWPGIALVTLCILSPAALAQKSSKKKAGKSLAACTSFDQVDRDDEDGVDLSVSSTCDVKMSCTIKWRLTCSPDSKKKRKSTWEGYSFELEGIASGQTTAAATSCGNNSWSIDSISWSCQPLASE